MKEIFQVTWLDGAHGLSRYEGKPCEATLADLAIQVGSLCLTRNTILDNGEWYARETVRLCMHPLAHWFAWNFYRLLYEPLPETQGRELALEWLMAHDMAYVGDGFLWPPVRIYSDGARMTLRLNRTQVPNLDPVQYTNTASVILPIRVVEDQILRFLKTCDTRLMDMGIKDSPFQVVYRELDFEPWLVTLDKGKKKKLRPMANRPLSRRRVEPEDHLLTAMLNNIVVQRSE
ncbi:hypothetical protein HFV02_03945 [Acidithiobacillus caldus]|uniref:hypothetical protein n=2 Tax=Acidithiobacillus caldus TaxID=33059 RepID=UPI001C066B19|nr:hypothetical protein [Acidithiobacillus caldus]MBU2801419.1 hypothetical protein [Acidithiobacillus caldus]